MLMSYTAEVVRGWPYDGSLDLFEPITAGGTVSNGDWVIKKTDGTIDKISTTLTSGTITNQAVGLVMQGNGDSPTSTVNGLTVGNSAQNANGPYLSTSTGLVTTVTNGRATVLWGNFIADIAVSSTIAATFAVGNPFTFKAVGGVGTIAPATGSDPVFGFVVAVHGNTSSTTETSRIRVKMA